MANTALCRPSGYGGRMGLPFTKCRSGTVTGRSRPGRASSGVGISSLSLVKNIPHPFLLVVGSKRKPTSSATAAFGPTFPLPLRNLSVRGAAGERPAAGLLEQTEVEGIDGQVATKLLQDVDRRAEIGRPRPVELPVSPAEPAPFGGRPDDHEGSADHLVHGNEAEPDGRRESRVPRMRAVVTQDKQLAGRDLDRAEVGDLARVWGQQVGLGQRLAVDGDDATVDLHGLAGQADDPFDEVLVGRGGGAKSLGEPAPEAGQAAGRASTRIGEHDDVLPPWRM